MNEKVRATNLLRAGRLPGKDVSPTFDDPESDGIFLQNLKRGDIVGIETVLVRGVGLLIDMEVVTPEAAAVKIRKVIQRSAFFGKSVNPEVIGIQTPVVVVRSFGSSIEDGPKMGWIGINCHLTFSGGVTINQPVKAIIINGARIFPQHSEVNYKI